jgi:hypothetical protein
LGQDADFEYDPAEYPAFETYPRRSRGCCVWLALSRRRGNAGAVANQILTLASNVFTDLNLTDMETCYKVFRREILAQVDIAENRFGFEPEITAKIARLPARPRVYEVGISYSGRTYEEGKKIGFRDAVRALYGIVRYNLFSRWGAKISDERYG